MSGSEANFTRDSCLKVEIVFFPIICFQFLLQPLKPRREQNKSSRRFYRILIGSQPWIRRIKASLEISSSTQQGSVSLQTFFCSNRRPCPVCPGVCSHLLLGQQPGSPPHTPAAPFLLGASTGEMGGSRWLFPFSFCFFSPSHAFLSIPANFAFNSMWCNRA